MATIEQVVIESSSAFVGPGAYTVEETPDGDCVVCPSDEETLAVQVYEAGAWRDCRAGEDYDPRSEYRWGNGYGYPWTHIKPEYGRD